MPRKAIAALVAVALAATVIALLLTSEPDPAPAPSAATTPRVTEGRSPTSLRAPTGEAPPSDVPATPTEPTEVDDPPPAAPPSTPAPTGDCALSGRLLLEGAPVAGEVTLSAGDATPVVAVAGADGRFRVAGLASAVWRFAARGGAVERGEGRLTTFPQIGLGMAETRDLGDIALEPVAAVRLTVVDELGAPVGGVDAHDANPPAHRRWPTVTTDAAGRALVRLLPLGRPRLKLTSPVHFADEVQIDARSGPPGEVTATLRRCGFVEPVVGPGDVEPAVLWLLPADGGGLRLSVGVATQVSPGRYRLQADGHLVAEVEVPPGATVRPLAPGAVDVVTIEGVVRSASGAPLAGVTVEPLCAARRGAAPAAAGRPTRSGPDGAFTVAVRAGLHVELVVEDVGRFEVEAAAPGARRRDLVGCGPHGSNPETWFRLEGETSGSVSIHAVSIDDPRHAFSAAGYSLRGVEEYVVQGMPPGAYMVVARGVSAHVGLAGRARIEVGDGARGPFTVPALPTAPIHVRVDPSTKDVVVEVEPVDRFTWYFDREPLTLLARGDRYEYLRLEQGLEAEVRVLAPGFRPWSTRVRADGTAPIEVRASLEPATAR